MTILIAKYIFWILICIPLLIFAIDLFKRLVKESNAISKENNEAKARALAEKKERERFSHTYYEQREKQYKGEK